jgi:DeoR family suf operon transcriptional repressor
VLAVLKRHGEAAADELAAAMDISTSAVRQHLNALRSGGYVASRQVRGQPGRPADRYHATELTEPLFATTDNSLSVELLTLIEEEDPELVNRVFERRRRRLIDRAERQLADEPIDRQVSAVAALLDAEGYLADSEKLGEHRYQIRLHSCAIWPVARQYGQACNANSTSSAASSPAQPWNEPPTRRPVPTRARTTSELSTDPPHRPGHHDGRPLAGGAESLAITRR